MKPTLLKIQNKKRWPSREKRQKDRFHHPKECLEAANRRSKLDWTERKGVWEALNTREKGMQTNRINFEDGTKQSALLIETLKLLLNLIDTAFAFIHIHGLNKIYSRNRHHFETEKEELERVKWEQPKPNPRPQQLREDCPVSSAFEFG